MQLAARVNNTAVIAEIIGTVLLAVTVVVAFGIYAGEFRPGEPVVATEKLHGT